MENKPDVSELKRAMVHAENKLEELKKSNIKFWKQKRISRALEKAYALLNLDNYTKREVALNLRRVLRSLEDDIPFIWLFIFGILFTGSFTFAVYETYSFIHTNLENVKNWHYDDVSSFVSVNYKETNIVNLTDLVPVSDEIGLLNEPQEFDISNSSEQFSRNMNYKINYDVNLVEMNSSDIKLLDKKYIKYRITHEDINGREVTSQIGTLDMLKKNPDGSYRLLSDSEARDKNSHFKVVFWLSSEATNEQQSSSYTCMFKVNAVIEMIK